MKIVTVENVENFLQDFGTMLTSVTLMKTIDPLVEITQFNWIDDGKNDGKFIVTPREDLTDTKI